MNVSWYPGHMTRARREMEESVKLVDLVIEILDARIPEASQNPDIEKIASSKSRLIIMCKADLADKRVTSEWEEFFKNQGLFTCAVDAKNSGSLKVMTAALNRASKAIIEKNRKRGIISKPIRAMVVGIPNVGKSTVINTLSGRACAKTGNTPGVTKKNQWLRQGKLLELLDTPGILWPKFESELTGLHLAMVGSVNDNIINMEELAANIIEFLRKRYPDALKRRYEVDIEGNEYEILAQIALYKHCIKKSAQADTEKMARTIVDDFRKGKFGSISIERPDNEGL